MKITRSLAALVRSGKIKMLVGSLTKPAKPGRQSGKGKSIPVGSISGNCKAGKCWSCTSINCGHKCHGQSLEIK